MKTVLEFTMVAPGHVYYTARVTLDMEHVVWLAREAMARKGKRISCQGIEVKLKRDKRHDDRKNATTRARPKRTR